MGWVKDVFRLETSPPVVLHDVYQVLLGPSTESKLEHLVLYMRAPLYMVHHNVLDEYWARPDPARPGEYLTYPCLKSGKVVVAGLMSGEVQLDELNQTYKRVAPRLMARPMKHYWEAGEWGIEEWDD